MLAENVKRILLVFLLTCMIMTTVVSEGVAQGVNNAEASALTGPRKQLATIIFSGLAGSLLGLSTLSFYGRPQDNLENIAIGFAVGVMLGTGYVTWNAATAPDDFLGIPQEESNLNFSRQGRELYLAGKSSSSFILRPISYGWSF